MAGSPEQIRFIEKCYELYEDKMYRVAFNILHDVSSAEDAVQDAFVKLIRNKVVFENANSDDCKKFIITVVKNSAIDIYRKQSQVKTVFFEDMPEPAAPEVTSTYSESYSLQEEISRLPDKYKTVIDCLAIKGMSVKETSDYLGISESNVRKRCERARKLLKKGGYYYG